MRFACDSCGAQYMIADEKVGARGVKVKCKKCGNMIVVKPAPEAAAASAPAATADTSAGMSASSGFGGGLGGETQTQAPQGELGGAFNAMFGSSQPPAGDMSSSDPSSNDSYSNGNGNHAPADNTNNNAFGFQSGYGSSGGETDLALGSLEQQAQAPISSDRAGERVWYVAIEDAQVGPVNMAEVEERWDNKEIDEDTLVWKAGMADWIPLVDVQELAYLITERPQQSRGAARAAMGAAAGASMSSSAGMSSSSYGGPQEMGDEPSWKPSAASALSSLVQEELVTKKPERSEAPASPPKGMEGLGLGTNDIFGSGNGGGTPITMGQPAAPQPAADPFGAGGSPAWSVPSARRSGSGMGTKIILGFLGLAVLGLGGAMAYMFTRPQPPAPPPTVIVQQAPTPPPAVPAVDPNAPPAPPPVPTPPPVVTKNEGSSKHAGEHRGDEPRTGKEPKGPKAGPKDPLDDIEGKTPAASNAPSVKEKLEKDDIIDGVKANGSKLGPCVTAARSKDEIQPGRVQFVLDWTINPNGSVTAARLKGPQEVMNTSLPSCFARVMGSWKFAASKTGAPIANFPLPITVH